MRAARLAAPGTPFVVEDLPEPRPGPGEVVVRVAACGLCASDLHVVEGLALPPGASFPITPGHEIAGEVVEVGEGVRAFAPGDRVAVHPNIPCGRCASCRRGQPNICTDPQVLGYHRPGGFCEYTAVPADGLIRVPDGLPLEQAAIVPDAVTTPYHALISRGRLRPGESVAVFGLGGLGVHALLVARLAGARRVIAVVRRAEAVERARQFGATDVVLTGEGNPARAIKELTGGGVDLAADFTGAASSIGAAAASVRMGGRLVVAGMSGEKMILPSSVHFARWEVEVLGAYTSSLWEAQTVMDLVGAGRLDLSRSITHRFALDDVQAAFDCLRDRSQNPIRIVVRP
ncbi:MAG: zinc-binding dehydrogenase [Clostridia bacterium]|nr:zinc-binding dehydrogenase [Clostridia bacterium]